MEPKDEEVDGEDEEQDAWLAEHKRRAKEAQEFEESLKQNRRYTAILNHITELNMPRCGDYGAWGMLQAIKYILKPCHHLSSKPNYNLIIEEIGPEKILELLYIQAEKDIKEEMIRRFDPEGLTVRIFKAGGHPYGEREFPGKVIWAHWSKDRSILESVEIRDERNGQMLTFKRVKFAHFEMQKRFTLSNEDDFMFECETGEEHLATKLWVWRR